MTNSGIGQLRERGLHAALKAWYARPGDQLEARVGGYVVDITRGNLLIEIQTGSFAAVRDKLLALTAAYAVRLVYPIAVAKWIVHIDAETGEVKSRRKSPRRGQLADLFDELVYLPTLMQQPNLSLEVTLVHADELRCADGRGSWRRQGVSIVDHALVEVLDQALFESPRDLLRLLPEALPEPFTNRELAVAAGLRRRTAQRMTYCLRKLDLLADAGRRGRERLFQRV
jgi:hypothetical protein